MNTNMLYCIRHERMERAESLPFAGGERILGHVYIFRIGAESELDFCEFDLGFAYCPPPEFDMDAWMDGAEMEIDTFTFHGTLDFDAQTGQLIYAV